MKNFIVFLFLLSMVSCSTHTLEKTRKASDFSKSCNGDVLISLDDHLFRFGNLKALILSKFDKSYLLTEDELKRQDNINDAIGISKYVVRELDQYIDELMKMSCFGEKEYDDYKELGSRTFNLRSDYLKMIKMLEHIIKANPKTSTDIEILKELKEGKSFSFKKRVLDDTEISSIPIEGDTIDIPMTIGF